MITHTKFPAKDQVWFHPMGGTMTLVKHWATHSDFTEWICLNACGKRCIRVLDLMHPAVCPITGLRYWGHVNHPEHGSVPTYGGPFDTYMVPERTGEIGADDEWTVHRYDQDAAEWSIEGFLPVELPEPTMNIPEYKPTKLIFGMLPWMFWTLLSVVLFTLFGPFLALLFR